MRMTVFLIAMGFALASCTHNDAGAGNNADSLSAGPINGESAYKEHCAGCHETGMMGAPREGEPQDWQERSSLWQAVLMEHAKTGYFEMPARGGKSELPDEIVNAAAEYMLETTFPNRPED